MDDRFRGLHDEMGAHMGHMQAALAPLAAMPALLEKMDQKLEKMDQKLENMVDGARQLEIRASVSVVRPFPLLISRCAFTESAVASALGASGVSPSLPCPPIDSLLHLQLTGTSLLARWPTDCVPWRPLPFLRSLHIPIPIIPRRFALTLRTHDTCNVVTAHTSPRTPAQRKLCGEYSRETRRGRVARGGNSVDMVCCCTRPGLLCACSQVRSL